MYLRYTSADGHPIEHLLGAEVITLGRAPTAALPIQGDKISRIHCGIRLWDSDYVLKDYGSTNGTFLNEKRVDAAILRPGDVIRIGNVRIQVEEKPLQGATTVLRELSREMETGGKGYRTMLREIVRSTEPESKKTAPDTATDSPAP